MYHARTKETRLLSLKGETLSLSLIFIGPTATQTTEWAASSQENIRYRDYFFASEETSSFLVGNIADWVTKYTLVILPFHMYFSRIDLLIIIYIAFSYW